MKSGKVWGETTALLANPAVELHWLRVLPNSFCSLHSHAARFNAFYVVKGTLFVEVHQKSYALVDTTELGPGELVTVSPGLKHRFLTKDEACECLELYYPMPLGAADIERQDVGGHHEPTPGLPDQAGLRQDAPASSGPRPFTELV